MKIYSIRKYSSFFLDLSRIMTRAIKIKSSFFISSKCARFWKNYEWKSDTEKASFDKISNEI